MTTLPLGFLAVLGLFATLGVVAPASAYASAPPSPPEDSPFSHPVGGEQLGTTGAAVYPEQAASAPPPDVDAAAYVVADLDSGAVHAARNAHRALPPADTLKTLTALTLLPRLDPRAVHTATGRDVRVPGRKAGLRRGEEYTIEQLFHGLLLASGNDAAHALASANRGADATVTQMTEQARRLGAYDTTVRNPSGRDAAGQVSSAYDLALIGRAAMRNEDLVQYVTTPTVQFPGAQADGESGRQKDADQGADGKANGDTDANGESNGGGDAAGTAPAGAGQLENTNELLTAYPGAIGVKDGHSPNAGHTLIGAAERGDHRLLVVLLGSEEEAAPQAARLLDWGFEMRTATSEASSGDEPAAAVGRLVEPRDVVRAANDDTDGTSRPSRPIDEEEAGGPAFTRPEQGSESRRETLASAAVGMLNTQTVLLLGGWLIFIVLASLRVRSYVRTHHPRRPRQGRRNPVG